MEYSQDELTILGDACIAIFLLVSLSDGKMSKAEQEVFFRDHVRAISAAKIIDNPKERAIMEIVIAEHSTPEYLAKLKKQGEEENKQMIRRATSLVAHKEEPKGLKLYRIAMLSLAKNIASASKGFLGLGAEVSSKEEEMIAKVKDALSR